MRSPRARDRRPLTAPRLLGWIAALTFLLVVCVVLGCSFGAGSVSLVDLIPGGAEPGPAELTILFEVRPG